LPAEREKSTDAKLRVGKREFLDQLANGFASRENATRMKINLEIIPSSVCTGYEKLHLHSRSETVVKHLRG